MTCCGCESVLDRVLVIEGPAGPGLTPEQIQDLLDLLNGSFSAGTDWWFGSGPPGVVAGSKPGDVYLDVDNGNIYKLGK